MYVATAISTNGAAGLFAVISITAMIYIASVILRTAELVQEPSLHDSLDRWFIRWSPLLMWLPLLIHLGGAIVAVGVGRDLGVVKRPYVLQLIALLYEIGLVAAVACWSTPRGGTPRLLAWLRRAVAIPLSVIYVLGTFLAWIISIAIAADIK